MANASRFAFVPTDDCPDELKQRFLDDPRRAASPDSRWGGIGLYMDACKWSRYDSFIAYYWNDALGHDRPSSLHAIGRELFWGTLIFL